MAVIPWMGPFDDESLGPVDFFGNVFEPVDGAAVHGGLDGEVGCE